MKTFSLLFWLLLFKIVFCTAQNPNIRWQNTLGGSLDDIARSVCASSDSDFMVAGYANGNSGDISGNHSGGSDYWLVNLNNKGKVQWQRCYGGSTSEAAYSVKQTQDKGFIIVGAAASDDGDVVGHHPYSDFTGHDDAWIVKIDSIGNIQWATCYGGSGEDYAQDIEITNDGGYVVAGLSDSEDGDISSNHGGGGDVWILKLDVNGKIQWSKSNGGSNFDGGRGIIQLSDGDYIFTGTSYSDDGDITNHHGTTSFADLWVVRINSSGDIVWQKSYGGSGFDIPASLVQMSSDKFVIAGYSTSNDGDATNNHGGYDYWVIKINGTGDLLYQNSLGGSGDDLGWSVIKTDNGGVLVAGYSNSYDGDVTGNHGFNADDEWIIRLGSTLKFKQGVCLGGSNTEQAYSIVETKEKDFVIAGLASSTDGDVKGLHNSRGENYFDYWIVRLKHSALSTTDEGSSTVKENKLSQNEFNLYPNPSTNNFHLQSSSPIIQLTVSDLSGRVMEENKNIDTEITFGDALAEGIYFIQLKFKDGSLQTMKLVKAEQ